MIDPTCGCCRFLLGAFGRLVGGSAYGAAVASAPVGPGCRPGASASRPPAVDLQPQPECQFGVHPRRSVGAARVSMTALHQLEHMLCVLFSGDAGRLIQSS
jgi:hypothetical protein